jgi:hypothetical protein
LETLPTVVPYNIIMQRLLGAHQMTEQEKADDLCVLPALGDRKPFEMMAAIRDMPLKGGEEGDFCMFLFYRDCSRRFECFSPGLIVRTARGWPKMMMLGGPSVDSLQRLRRCSSVSRIWSSCMGN